MIVIWGTRRLGKVDQRGGQYALTRFAHVYWLPLLPIGAVWMTGDSVGHDMKLTARGVVAGYARTWGLVLGVIGIAAGGSALALGVVSAAVGALSIAWKDVRGAGAQRRSDLNWLAYGTRCEPHKMPPELAALIRSEVTTRWARLSDGQSPSDVARFGTDNVDRAAAAYGVLRLSAMTLPPKAAAEAERDAARIADQIRELPQLGEGGPYRAAPLGESIVDRRG